VGTMEMGLGVSADATRTLEDIARATLGPSVKLSTVALRRFRPVGNTFVESPVVPATSHGRAHHEMLTHSAADVHARRHSNNRYIHFSPEWCL